MVVHEYGEENKEIILLLHGGGLSWWNYRKEAEILKDRFHVIIPVLDGHAGSDENFKSIEDNAKELIDYIDQECSGSVFLIGGLSLGGQILVEMLSQRSDICTYAIIESALIFPMKATHRMIQQVVGMSYGLIKQKWFSKLQFASLKMNKELFEDYYTDTCKITKENMIDFLKANSDYTVKDSLKNSKVKAAVIVGGKEQRIMKKSAKRLNELLKTSSLNIIAGYYHGELSINHPEEYIRLIDRLIEV